MNEKSRFLLCTPFEYLQYMYYAFILLHVFNYSYMYASYVCATFLLSYFSSYVI